MFYFSLTQAFAFSLLLYVADVEAPPISRVRLRTRVVAALLNKVLSDDHSPLMAVAAWGTLYSAAPS